MQISIYGQYDYQGATFKLPSPGERATDQDWLRWQQHAEYTQGLCAAVIREPIRHTPLTRGALGALPLLLEAQGILGELAAPQASRLADRIGAALEGLIELAGEVEAYGNKWAGGDMASLAERLRRATAEYNTL